MGKAKKRIFNKNTDEKGSILKRKEIIKQVVFDVKNNNISEKTRNYISLFGISSEELTEAGASFEEISAVGHLI